MFLYKYRMPSYLLCRGRRTSIYFNKIYEVKVIVKFNLIKMNCIWFRKNVEAIW